MSSFVDRVGAAPISWGICEAPGWGLQLNVDRVLTEARELGISAIEQGALGWLPAQPAAMKAKLDEYDMQLLGGFVALVLHDPQQSAATLTEADRIAGSIAAAGGEYFVTCPVPSLEAWFRPDLTADQWDELLGNLDRLDAIVGAHGLYQAVHPHVDTVIERADDFQRFLDGCSAKTTYDTGHLAIGGTDIVQTARDHLDRIAVVHLKDVNMAVAERMNAGELTLMEATQAGLFPPLGEGDLPVAEVIDVVEARGYDGWYVMETDTAITDGEPAAGTGPAEGVRRSLEYLRSLDAASHDSTVV